MMLRVLYILMAFLSCSRVRAAAVFAHFMVGNTENFTVDDWTHNMQLALDAHIDAFALNMASGWYYNLQAVANAFAAARTLNSKFKLFFSFDYAGNGSWPEAEVISMIHEFGALDAYYKYHGKPFASTFEGPGNAKDWINIKAQTGCFFMPDWSSVGAGPAMELAGGVADGLFSWAAWPWGNLNMTTYVDASYNQTLTSAGKPYMMPVSPWFYTNMPGYNKNWLWRGDDLWYQRWMQVWYLQPEFVEIISWNDFGESHYIGPLDDRQYSPFKTGEAPFNYANNMPHDGWREMLPYVIDTYKNGIAEFKEEKIIVWYRNSLADDCDAGNTTGNTAQQLQIEFPPNKVMQDRVFVTALLREYGQISVIGESKHLSWDFIPENETGLYHTSFPLNHASNFQLALVRGGVEIFDIVTGSGVSATNCVKGLTNWNAYVDSVTSAAFGATAKSPHTLQEQQCVQGYGAGNFDGLCQFTCKYGYCPVGACVCTAMGTPEHLPKPTGVQGYPANGDANYGGLCSFACNYGYCPDNACSTTKQPPYVPTSSPFLPPACTAGTGTGSLTGLCSYACNFGFCPMHACSCTAQGALVQPPAQTNRSGFSLVGKDSGLCSFTCSRNYCPYPTCTPNRWPHPHNLIAYGDSYAAGVGARCGWIRDEFDNSEQGFDCRRCEGAYPYQLLTAGDQMENTVLRFPACTGAVIADMETATPSREAQLRMIVDKQYYASSGWATISIGGNDLGFGDIAWYCLYWWNEDKCTRSMANAATKLQSDDFRLQLSTLYDNIFLDALAQRPSADGFLLVVTGYIQFFYDKDRACDQSYFLRGSYLTQELRQQLNSLVVKFNNVIQAAVAETQAEWGSPGWSVIYFDSDSLFEGHRFCQPGNDYRTSWFFVPWGADALDDGTVVPVTQPASTEKGVIDLTTYWKTCQATGSNPWIDLICEYSIAMHNGTLPDFGTSGLYGPSPGTTMMAPWEAQKTMHPKTMGHSAISKGIYSLLSTFAP